MLDTPVGARKPIPYKNEKTEFSTLLYPISVLALSLGRSQNTIRQWEILGDIPKTPFKVSGRRYYCEEQIKACMEVAEKVHLSGGKTHISHTTFKREVKKRWREIFKEIFGEDLYLKEGE